MVFAYTIDSLTCQLAHSKVNSPSAKLSTMNVKRFIATLNVFHQVSVRYRVKPAFKLLKWLPVEHKILYKLCAFMHKLDRPCNIILSRIAPQQLPQRKAAETAYTQCLKTSNL